VLSSSWVTLDLNGFRLRGTGLGTGTSVAISPGVVSVTIKNGSIEDWGGWGVNTGGASGAEVIHLANLLVRDNNGGGIDAVGPSMSVSDVIVDNNQGLFGLRLGFSAMAHRVIARGNSGQGISTGNVCRLTECIAQCNAGRGIELNGKGSQANGCISENNGLWGFDLASHCMLTGCTARNNQADGIRAFGEALITGCLIVGNTSDGIDADSSLIRGNIISGNGDLAINGANNALFENFTP